LATVATACVCCILICTGYVFSRRKNKRSLSFTL
jgi:hypothetical protein